MKSPFGESGEKGGTGTREAPGPPLFLEWILSEESLDLATPVVMGILNLTPDSFSDGGDLASFQEALDRGRLFLRGGARLLDVGGESTRPGADPVPLEEELERVVPFIRRASEEGLGPLSIDTRNAEVAREALRAGAQVVNDVSALTHDPEMAEVVAEAGAGLVLSHMRGTPGTMRELASYEELSAEVVDELGSSLSIARDAGIPMGNIVVDPGIGFAKTGRQSMELLGNLAPLKALGCPILVGPSRKSFIGEVTGASPKDRVPGTIAACVLAFLGGARIFRVHDVAPVVQALSVTQAILASQDRTSPE